MTLGVPIYRYGWTRDRDPWRHRSDENLRIDSLDMMDSLDDFLERRRKDLAARTAILLYELAGNLNLETIERELHRITGTCGSYGLMEGSRGAANLLARVRDDQIGALAAELSALAKVFTQSAGSGEF